MRIMGNLYTDNLIGTVIGLSVADDWEGARREWEIVGCEVDETHSATCVCGKEGLRYVYTIANTETGETLSPIGSSCMMVITTTYSCLTCSTEDSVRKRRRENAKLSSCNPSTHG